MICGGWALEVDVEHIRLFVVVHPRTPGVAAFLVPAVRGYSGQQPEVATSERASV